MSDVLIKAEGVSKKFCKDLKRSMLYGIQDISKTIIRVPTKTDELKPAEFWALDDISFELKRGECLGLIGPNGSGKSTLLKILNGIISPDKGRVEIKGSVGALIEIGAGFHPNLTGRENIYINGSILGFSKREIDEKLEDIIEFAEISEFIDTPVKHYSSGMRVRLGFAIAAQIKPDVLLIDEVLAVGDLGFRYKCFNKISELMRQAAIIFISHDMPQIARICSSVIVLNKGIVIYNGEDVVAGIQKYSSQFTFPEGFVAGSGKAKLLDLKIWTGQENFQEDDIAEIAYGDDLIIDMLLALEPEAGDANIIINILDQQQRAVMQCMSGNSGVIIQNQGKPVKISAKLPGINLNPASYQIWVVITDGMRREIYLTHYGIKTFRVRGPIIGFCAVQLDAKWDYHSVEHAAAQSNSY